MTDQDFSGAQAPNIYFLQKLGRIHHGLLLDAYMII